MARRAARKFTDEFKKQMVGLYNSGKPSSEIIKEYELTPYTFHKWVKQHNETGSFQTSDNLTPVNAISRVVKEMETKAEIW